MKKPLARLLRVRELVEDLSRREFESRSAEKRALEAAASRQRALGSALRNEAVDDLAQPWNAGHKTWRMKMADAEVAGWKRGKLDALAEAAQPEIDRAHGELMARRVERRQLEILHAAAVQAEERERVRQDQNRTDDWFQSRTRHRRS